MPVKYIVTILLSFLPISELRGAIPYAYVNNIGIIPAFIISVVSNALVPVVGYVFFDTLHKLFYKIPLYKTFFDKTIIKARKKVGEKIDKYGMIGLVVFVAIPLPVTGAWTGVIGAWVLGLDRKKSCLFIALGVLIAGIIVSSVVMTGAEIGSLFTKQIV